MPRIAVPLDRGSHTRVGIHYPSRESRGQAPRHGAFSLCGRWHPEHPVDATPNPEAVTCTSCTQEIIEYLSENRNVRAARRCAGCQYVYSNPLVRTDNEEDACDGCVTECGGCGEFVIKEDMADGLHTCDGRPPISLDEDGNEMEDDERPPRALRPKPPLAYAERDSVPVNSLIVAAIAAAATRPVRGTRIRAAPVFETGPDWASSTIQVSGMPTSRCPGCDNLCYTHQMRPLPDSADTDKLYCERCRRPCEVCNKAGVRTQPVRLSHRISRSRQACADCTFQCPGCGTNYLSTVADGRDAAGGRVCAQCAKAYATCGSCGVRGTARMYGHTESGDPECRACRDARAMAEESVNAEHVAAAIHVHSYKPRANFQYGKLDTPGGSDETAFYGIELEIEDPRGNRNRSRDAYDLSRSGFFYCKKDGSVPLGFEIVSHPATLSAWRELDLSFMSKLRRVGYRSYDTTTCGMHIHVSRVALNGLNLFKVLQWFKNERAMVVKLSRRRAGALEEWAAVDQRPTKGLIRKATASEADEDRYVAINTQNSTTVEFRIFRGTLDSKAFMRNLEFVNALIAFANHASVRDMKAGKFLGWLRNDGIPIIGKNAATDVSEWIGRLISKSENLSQSQEC